MKKPFTVNHALLCEDIREEKTGKHTLVGVYSGDVDISGIPGTMAIALYIELQVIIPGKYELSLRLSGPGEHSATLKANLALEKNNKFAILATPRIDLLVDREGILKIEMSMDGQVWTSLLEKKITLNPSLANAFQPPHGQSPTAAPDSSFPPEPSPQGFPKRRRRS